ncbi:thioesterase II family protein [Streptomyces triticirhizae]|uniref:thioesterase II family protein n=1 Tax=Streptomyces triticirhizae TaxID=2483353 RepID=UPI00131596BE|nr:thioesterase domain-containing protein [Streptomyces triticirhizae]
MTIRRASARWLSVCEGPPGSPLVLVAPFAGGGRAFYREWERLFSPWARLCFVTPPGRDHRIREPASTDLDRFLPRLVAACAELVDGQPYTVFGHSMGAMLGYEIASGLRDLGLPEPDHLVVSGLCSPDTPLPGRPLEEADDRELLAELAALMELPTAGPMYELLAAMLPTARADFTLCERYRWRPRPPLTTGITALWSVDDPLTTQEGVAAWARHTTGGFRELRFGGPHFFIRGLGGVVADALSAPHRGASPGRETHP